MPKPPKPHFGSLYQQKKRRRDGTVVELPTWWIKFHKDGQVFRESTKKTDREEAETYLARRIGEVASGTFHGLAIERTTIEELLDDLLADYRTNDKSVRFAENAINNHVRRFLKRLRAASLSTADIRKYVAFRRSSNQGMRTYRGRLAKAKEIPIRPASNATINRELALLKHAFYLGWRHTPRKVANVPHIPLLKEDNVRKGFFEHDQFLAMRRALPERLRPVLTFAYYTGCRRGEILGLRWEQADLVERVVRLEAGTTKNDEARILPLTEELYQVLLMQRSVREAKHPACPWVFFTDEGGPIHCFRRSWETACQAAGLTGDSGKANRLFHDLRRSGVRNLIRAAVPEAVAMRISGHKTRSVFDRYNIVSERDLKDAARRLEVYLKGKEQEQAADPQKETAQDGLGHTLGHTSGKTGEAGSAKVLQ